MAFPLFDSEGHVALDPEKHLKALLEREHADEIVQPNDDAFRDKKELVIATLGRMREEKEELERRLTEIIRAGREAGVTFTRMGRAYGASHHTMEKKFYGENTDG